MEVGREGGREGRMEGDREGGRAGGEGREKSYARGQWWYTQRTNTPTVL